MYDYRIKIYKDTKEFIERFFSVCPESIKYNEDYIDKKMLLNKTTYDTTKKPIVKVLPMDTLDCALQFINKSKDLYKTECFIDKNPLVLNMANPSHAGGGVDQGCSAQEENIFRRSNYSKTLYICPRLYPIIDTECIYSPEITVFRSSEQNLYKFLEKPYKVAMIASAGVAYPKVRYENDLPLFADNTEQELHYRKICMIFKTAFITGHKVLVLSALGCGAFKCPQIQVAEMFKKAIEEYGHLFDEIYFAIMNPVDSRKNNYEVFKKVLEV